MRHPYLCALPLLVLLAGCGDEPQPKVDGDKPAPKEPVSEQQRLIDNTAAASAVGYDGQGVKRAVQRTVDANNKHNDELQKAAETAGQSDPADTK